MKVAVVILNWNGRNFLRTFLPSVIKHSGQAEIIVADNASSDDSMDVVREEFPSLKLLLNEKNYGFAGGYNHALSKVDADYFILLNSDVEVTPGWIEPVIAMMERDSSIAAVQPKILSHADKSTFEYAGAAGGFIDKYGYPFCRGRIFNTLEKDSGQYNDARRIFWATGACMFVRASAFKYVNGFDEKFFAHMEEIDVCWRLQKAGGKIWYCPESTVYHVGGGTLHKGNPHKAYLNFRNNLLMLYKNLPEKDFEKVITFKRFFDTLAAIKFFASNGNFHETNAVFRAHSDFRKMKKDVEKTPNGNGVEISDVIYQGSIVRAYYLEGKKHFSQLGF
jgi:GT2 family glycosyltransferase